MNDMLSEKDAKALQDILVEQLGVTPEQLTANARIQEDLGADSLTVMEITMAVEDRFNLSIPDEQWERVRTVGDLSETLTDLISRETRQK